MPRVTYNAVAVVTTSSIFAYKAFHTLLPLDVLQSTNAIEIVNSTPTDATMISVLHV